MDHVAFLAAPVAECPYCDDPVTRSDPRGLNHADRMSHLSCLDGAHDGLCGWCEQPIARRHKRATVEHRGLCHATCAAAEAPSPPVPDDVPEIRDPLTLALVEVGRQRSTLARTGQRAQAVVGHPGTMRQLDAASRQVYSGRSLSEVLELEVRVDASLAPSELRVI